VGYWRQTQRNREIKPWPALMTHNRIGAVVCRYAEEYEPTAYHFWGYRKPWKLPWVANSLRRSFMTKNHKKFHCLSLATYLHVLDKLVPVQRQPTSQRNWLCTYSLSRICNEWYMNEWIKQLINEGMKDWTNKWTKEWPKQCTKKCTMYTERLFKAMNEEM